MHSMAMGEPAPTTLNKSRVSFAANTSVFQIETESVIMRQMSPRKKWTRPVQTGKNVAKVRWLQDEQTMLIPDPFATEYFVSGSWGDAQNDVSLYRLQVEGGDDEIQSQVDRLAKIDISGNVTDMTILDSQRFAITTTLGTVSVYKCGDDNQGEFNSISALAINRLHGLKNALPCPATALAAKENIVSVGEDGSIIESSSTVFQVIRKLDQVDPLSIYSVAFVGRSEILTGNAGGQLKLWDLRSNDNFPTQIMNPNVVMNNLYGAVSIAQHPSQSHLVIVGYHSGLVDLWDLRLGTGSDPVANLATDSGSLSEIYFHKINPDHFFSCSQSGKACHWYPNINSVELETTVQEDAEMDLNIEFLNRGLAFKEVYMSPLPVNSLSLSRNDRLACGGDNGIVFCTELDPVNSN